MPVESRPPATLADDELIADAVRGREPAFAELVDRYWELAFRAAWLVLRDADRATDAAQEAFINVHRALPRFRRGQPFRPWLLTIVGNRARNLARADRRRIAALERAAAGERLDPRHEPSPEARLDASERRRLILAAVDALPPDDRLALTCRYFADLGEAETAALLGVARGTVKSRLSRARERLRAHLMAEGLTDA